MGNKHKERNSASESETEVEDNANHEIGNEAQDYCSTIETNEPLNSSEPKHGFDAEEINQMDAPERDDIEEEELMTDKDKMRPNDPFSVHFDKQLESSDIDFMSKNSKKLSQDLEWNHMKKIIDINNDNKNLMPSEKLIAKKNTEELFLKNSIVENLSKAMLTSTTGQMSDLSSFQYELLTILSNYKDLLFTERNFENAEHIRLVYSLHALNHVLKTRSRILHHNYKISHRINSEDEYRDQGLTRPRVLILVPFRDSALRIVRIIISLIFGDTKDKNERKANVMNAKRFFKEFSPEEDIPKLHKKPEDYEMTFAGNIDDSFRIGISITKKSIKLYSDFYSSDIIIASPLGLRLVIGAEGDRERDFDFLSSIEMVIMDQTDVFVMQNWEHVLHIMKHLHLTPKESRGVDFSRVRMWTLEGWQKYYYQLLVFSSIAIPSITGFFNKYSTNYCGKILTKTEISSSKSAVNSVYIQCPQIFKRFDCTSLAESSDKRFEFFISTVLPKFRDKLMARTMIYIPSYFDYVRLRNYFRKNEINFTQICEYTKDGKVAKARSMFFNGGRHFLLYTERFHYYHRYKIKGIRHLIFYEMPNYPHFYSELINLMHISMQGKKFFGDYSSMSCTIIYNKFDALQLAAITGHQKAGQMLRSSSSVHMFVTESSLNH